MIPLLLVVAGAFALALGWLVLRRLGSGARVGRIIAATPVVGILRARSVAQGGRSRYLGVRGRIDSGEAFEDEHQRPLVYHRTRLETRAGPGSGSAWTAIEDERRVVPFDLSDGPDAIAVDGEALGEGLVVVTREAEGTAGEIPDRLPGGIPPATPVRLRIELLSTVDHALVLGVPMVDPLRGPIMRPGFGRPLVLTNLERNEAIRLLAAGRRGETRLAAALLAAGLGLTGLGLAWGVIDALR